MSEAIKYSSTGSAENYQRIPTVRLSFDPKTGELMEKPKKDLFLKGPIRIEWLNRAARLPGKSINVALATCWLAGMNGNIPFKLTKKALELFNVSADAATDALNKMEGAGLIKLKRNRGQRHLIEVLSVNTDK